MKHIALIYNAIVVICFTVLACYFNKWWIVLLSYLLLCSYHYKEHEENEDIEESED